MQCEGGRSFKGDSHSSSNSLKWDSNYLQFTLIEPPEHDDVLPDLYRLMDSLEDGHSDLESQNEPPSLFTRPEHVPKYKKITELKMEIEVSDV